MSEPDAGREVLPAAEPDVQGARPAEPAEPAELGGRLRGPYPDTPGPGALPPDTGRKRDHIKGH